MLIAGGAAALLILIYSLWRGASGAFARLFALAIILGALANPMIVNEMREGLDDVVALVIDRSLSQDLGTRSADAERTLSAMRNALSEMNIEIREAQVRTDAETGTALFGALDAALSQIPADRLAGAIVITDGEAHDPPELETFRPGAPLHVLLTGEPDESDRKLIIVRASRFAIVGDDAEITLLVEDVGQSAGNATTLTLRVDGEAQGSYPIPVGQETTIRIPVTHGGENVVELEISAGTDEQTMQNNRAVLIINGVRDRLRVLLVSGEPHAGERVWRDLLKADPTVDLVHFTILRPPEKQDYTPINELSLIAFPTRELFDQKLYEFDLVVLDRYQNRGILPLAYFENLARYVEDGGALLLATGPEFADPATSIYRTPLAAVLPAQPTGTVTALGFKPEITALGFAHPVTGELDGSNRLAGVQEAVPADWGRWFRVIDADQLAGTTVMSGPESQPLLVLDRVGEGRVAQLLSDHIWLWARGFEGGGPQAELLRRLAHWLMKEPDLEEERLLAEVADGELRITRRTMAPQAAPVTVTSPSGETREVNLVPASPGLLTANIPAQQLGLYHLTDNELNAVAAAGPLNPREVADMRATEEIVSPYVEATDGSIHWLTDGIPELRFVDPGDDTSGNGWIGITQRGAYRVVSVEQEPLLPPWLALTLMLGSVLIAWRLESR
ncbi:MAG: hypothetical protein IID54_01225 [Proteobacteria bacterium]|nr:hypothetical protein [Pseudomonadota bacterium]